MKRFISLIIFSLIFKGYVSDCTKNDETCTGASDGKICVLENEACIEKTLCVGVEPNNEADCTKAPTEDDTKYKCVFKAKDTSNTESKNKCEQKNLCKKVETANEQSCTEAPTSNTVTLKCVLKTEENTKKCVEEKKKSLEIEAGGNDTICGEAGVSNDKKKCVADNGKCKEVEKDAESNKNATKSSTKAGSNYLNLSFALLSLFFL